MCRRLQNYNLATIVPKKQGACELGQRKDFSETDIRLRFTMSKAQNQAPFHAFGSLKSFFSIGRSTRCTSAKATLRLVVAPAAASPSPSQRPSRSRLSARIQTSKKTPSHFQIKKIPTIEWNSFLHNGSLRRHRLLNNEHLSEFTNRLH